MIMLTEYDYARCYGYDLLRRFFLEEPDSAFIIYLKTHNTVSALAQFSNDPHIKENIFTLSNLLSSLPTETDASIYRTLHWEYTQMFVGPDSLLVPPYESYYATQDALLFQQCTHDVMACYTDAGFILPSSYLEAADHIGLELDFMYHLSCGLLSAKEKTSGNIRKQQFLIEQQTLFLQCHLLSFSVSLAKKIQCVAKTDFYFQISQFLCHFLKLDYQKIRQTAGAQYVR